MKAILEQPRALPDTPAPATGSTHLCYRKPGLNTIGVMIFALIDLWQVPAADVRGGSRFLWTLAILLLPVVGAGLWLLFGREPAEGPKRRFLPPDDDPDFLRRMRSQ